MNKYLYIIGIVILTIYGQIIIKWIVNQNQIVVTDSLIQNFKIFIKFFLDPYVISGLISAFLSSFFWIIVVAKFELSQAYPVILGGLALLTTFFAILLFKESITIYKITGIVMIVLGIILLNKAV